MNNPCHFAHGKDELEIWELYRSRGNFFQDYTIATNSISTIEKNLRILCIFACCSEKTRTSCRTTRNDSHEKFKVFDVHS